MIALKFRPWFVSLVLTVGLNAWGQAPAPSPPKPVAVEQLQKAWSAVVQVNARAIEGAPSAATLGKIRRGSGVVIGPDDLILTIAYLVTETEQLNIRTQDQKTYPARVVASDSATGLALLRPLYPLTAIAPVALGQASLADVGQTFAVASGEAGDTMSPARLMDVRNFTGYWEYHLDTALYASPPIGNHSGAGLFNTQGELVGIGSLLMQDIMPASDPRSLPGNMFVPTELLGPYLQDMLATGSSPKSNRPWLGINAVERSGRIQITRVTPKSPADLAGLTAGAFVLSLDGEPLSSLALFYKKVWAKPMSSGVFELTVQERGETRQLKLEIRDRNQTIQKPAGI